MALRDTSRRENESRSGRSVDQDDQDELMDELFHIGVVWKQDA